MQRGTDGLVHVLVAAARDANEGRILLVDALSVYRGHGVDASSSQAQAGGEGEIVSDEEVEEVLRVTRQRESI